MANILIDNSERFKLVKTIKELVVKSDRIMIATGYWDLPGMNLIFDELRGFFGRGGTLKLLIGQEPQLHDYQVDDEARRFPDFYIQRDMEKLTDEYQPVGQLILDFAAIDHDSRGQFEIRVYGQGEHREFLHAKCYIFSGRQLGTGIVGSSNFTRKGLEDNAELNYLEENSNAVTGPYDPERSTSKSHEAWFNELWERSEPWTGHFINDILKKSPLGPKLVDPAIVAPLTPYEVYIKYLQLQFGDMVDANTTEVLKSYLPASYNPLEYQLDAVKQCFSIMKRYGGFLLGDVVGLGKTVVGMLIVRHFLENAESLGREAKVLIITPPAIQKNWIQTIREFDVYSHNHIEPCVTFVTTGSIGKIAEGLDDVEYIDDGGELSIVRDTYGLIIIDESHNFRNNGTQKYEAVDSLIGSLTPTPYVALLSATPQNNSPRDIYNQIRLFQRDANNTTLPNVEGGKLDSFFSAQQKRFDMARSISQDTDEGRARAREIIAEVSDQVRKCVLNDLVVRRTRTDIRRMYGADAELLRFSTVKGPHKLEYRMDDELQKLFFDTTEAICSPTGDAFNPERHIGFYRYAAIAQLLKKEHRDLYEKRNLTVESTTRHLKRIMQILLVKRLESSLAAFRATLHNLRDYTETMIEMLRHDSVYICPDIDVNKVYKESEGDFCHFQATMEPLVKKKGGNNRRFTTEDFDQGYLDKLYQDKRLIERLLRRWDANEYDPKLDRFKEALAGELFAPDVNNPSGRNKPRLVIFTEAIDTLNTVVRVLRRNGHRVLAVSAKNRGDMQRVIEQNFDANQPEENRRDDYDVIVTTEVLAEGVNLHRANVILNYDAPWNATRLMQRIGRVNRIGSVEDNVHVFNFFPSAEGNAQIRLIEKAYAKLQSFHEMFGEDSKVFSEREELCEHDLQQIVDGDESPFGPYINELKAYRAEHPERYDLICDTSAEGLGGVLRDDGRTDSIFVFTDNTQGYISVAVDISGDIPLAKIISQLLTMQGLKCAPEVAFSESTGADTSLAAVARKAYQRHVAHYITQRDSNRKIAAALDVLSDIRNTHELTLETKKLLKQIEQLVRDKNNDIINMLIKCKPGSQQSLLNPDEDINVLLQSHFGRLDILARTKRGDARLAIYEIKASYKY